MLDAQLGDLDVQRRREKAEHDVRLPNERIELRCIADVQLNASRPIARQSAAGDHVVRRDRQLNVRSSGEDVDGRSGDEP